MNESKGLASYEDGTHESCNCYSDYTGAGCFVALTGFQLGNAADKGAIFLKSTGKCDPVATTTTTTAPPRYSVYTGSQPRHDSFSDANMRLLARGGLGQEGA